MQTFWVMCRCGDHVLVAFSGLQYPQPSPPLLDSMTLLALISLPEPILPDSADGTSQFLALLIWEWSINQHKPVPAHVPSACLLLILRGCLTGAGGHCLRMVNRSLSPKSLQQLSAPEGVLLPCV